jgi:hypothetical protein
MQSITTNGSVKLALLAEELSEVATFRRTEDGPLGPTESKDCGVVKGTSGDRAIVRFADDIDLALVQAVIDAHDRTGLSKTEVDDASRATVKASRNAKLVVLGLTEEEVLGLG